MTNNEARPPTVFISYSHDSPEHADRVLALSDHLRADGIDCILDQYQDSPPEGFPRWMDRQIRAADFVLMICTPTYYHRVMGEEEPGKGHGVAWESTLIYQYIYNEGTSNTRFIPILLEGAHESAIPVPWQGVDLAFILLSFVLIPALVQLAFLGPPQAARTAAKPDAPESTQKAPADNAPAKEKHAAAEVSSEVFEADAVGKLLFSTIAIGWVVFRVRANSKDLGFNLSHIGSDLVLQRNIPLLEIGDLQIQGVGRIGCRIGEEERILATRKREGVTSGDAVPGIVERNRSSGGTGGAGDRSRPRRFLGKSVSKQGVRQVVEHPP